MNNKEFIINLGNCLGLVYKFSNDELLVRYKDSSFWFLAQTPTKEYIINNPNLISYLENNNEQQF